MGASTGGGETARGWVSVLRRIPQNLRQRVRDPDWPAGKVKPSVLRRECSGFLVQAAGTYELRGTRAGTEERVWWKNAGRKI